MDDGHSNVLLTLEAASQAARKAWNLPQNRHRCPTPPSNDEDHEISSREATPAVHYAEPQLQLTFDDVPKNSQAGFVFGSDRQKCDVWLGERKRGFSAQLFSISPTDPRGVVFKDLWEGETTVVYKGETPLPRRHFTWILFREWPDIEISMTKQGFNFAFKVRWPDHPNGDVEKAEYERRLELYRQQHQNPTPAPTLPSLPSQASVGQPPIFLLGEELGRGSSGTVYKAVDVSTGLLYAAKEFQTLCLQSEVDIMRRLSHDRLVKFVTFLEEDKPLLVMEYHPLGNLSTQHRQSGITGDDCAHLLHQGLQALEYLHSEGVTHRDVSPGNIIVHARTPFTIKLCDFGLAKEGSIMHTQCGTYLYAAKEVFEGNYKNKIDVWSLGVVVMEYLFGLPPTRKRLPEKWYDDVVRKAEYDAEDDALMKFMFKNMLIIKHEKRATAVDCRENLETFLSEKDGHPGGEAVGIAMTRGSSEENSDFTGVSTETASMLHPADCVSPGFYRLTPNTTQVHAPAPEFIRPSLLNKRPQGLRTAGSFFEDVSAGRSKRSRATVASAASGRLPNPSGPAVFSQVAEQSEPPEERNLVRYDTGPQPPDQGTEPYRDGMLWANDGLEMTEDIEGHPTRPTGLPKQLRHASALFHPTIEMIPREIERASPEWRVQDIVRNTPDGNPLQWNQNEVQPIDHDLQLESPTHSLRTGSKQSVIQVQSQAKVTPLEGNSYPQYLEIKMDDMPVMIRRSDYRINAPHILKIAGVARFELTDIKKQLKPNSFDIVKRAPRMGQGTYVDFAVGIGLCRKYGLVDLEKRLHSIKSVSEELVVKLKPSVFFQVLAFPPVMVRKSDLRINSSQILGLADIRRCEATKIQKAFPRGAYDTVTGYAKHGGIYVDFSIGLELCRKYELAELAERLLELRSGSTNSTSKPTHVSIGSLNKILNPTKESPLPEPILFNPACSMKRASVSPALAGEQVIAEVAECIDSASDTDGSESSTGSHGSASIHGSVQSPNGALSVNSPGGRLQDKAGSLSFKAVPHLSYKFWDEQSERSHLTEAHPNLKSNSWRLGSHYGSFTE
ncbi:MAG: hypothetical protein Q9210_005025 [Variospora velana]